MPVPGDVIIKDKDSALFYECDWTNGLPSGETISTSTWLITGDDAALTQSNDSILSGSKKTRVRLSGGTLKTRYTVVNRIVTSGSPSQTADRSFFISVQEQ
jgi:hypothetical protein